MKKEPANRTCPYLRDKYPKRHYIGRMTFTEFDITDMFMVTCRGMTGEQLSDRLGLSSATIYSYTSNMWLSGMLGVVGYEYRKVEATAAPMEYHGLWEGPRVGYDMVQTHRLNVFGPTMKACHLWHDAVGEEWIWGDYVGQPWVADKGLLRSRTEKAA